MSDWILILNTLNADALKTIGTFSAAAATIIAAIILGIAGRVISGYIAKARDEQDRESEWRSHAIELTKLDMQRNISQKLDTPNKRLRPSILDFLANYRDLKDLDNSTPADLYKKVENARIKSSPVPADISGQDEAGTLASKTVMWSTTFYSKTE